MALKRSGDLGHLHQAEHPLLHAGTTRGADDQQRKLLGRGPLDQTRDPLAHHRAHRAPHEAEIHHGQCQTDALNPAEATHHTILQPGRCLAFPQAIGISAPILELQGIHGSEIRIEFLKAAWIGDHLDAFTTVDAVVIAAARTDTGIGLEILEVDNLAAFRALVPEAVTLILFLTHLADKLTLPAISEPVEQRHGNRTVPTIKDPAGGPTAATTKGGL